MKKRLAEDCEFDDLVGRTLQDLREERGVPQLRLAEDAKGSRAFLHRIERGVSSPSLRKIFMLCQILGVKPSDFVKRIEKQWPGFSVGEAE